MAADGEDTKLEEFEEQLRDVGARLQSAPDDAEGLLKLLSEVEAYLLKVDQSPPESTSSAIRPAMAALARKELLGHLNADVKLAVASCISEITRITAPEAPYDDDVMRDVFFIIVGAFQHLDEIDSPSFGRRVSILDTVAKVRSCVVMLDLECDDLIREMFHHFFRTVSSNHPDIVISSMVTTMKLVIEESEDVQTELASCLLRNVKNEEKETSPASFELAEKVIGLCQEKLKSVFLQLLQGTPLNEYSKIVTSVLDVREDNNVDPSGKDTVDDGKLSERTISDELPQDSSQLEQDVSGPEQDGAPTIAISSGATPVDNGAESVAAKPNKSSDLDSDKDPKPKPSFKSEAVAHSNDDIDNTKAVNGADDDTSKPADSTPDVIKPKRGRPPGPKSLEKKAAGKNYPSGLDLKKAVATDSAGKLTKRSAKDDVRSFTRKAGEGESSKKQQKISSEQQKGETLSEEDTSKDLIIKEMVSPKSLTKGSGRTKGQSSENSGVKRKRVQETEETPRSRKNKGLDGSLVGAKIKVWWPDDKKFYKGVVNSFDTASKRHKIAYDDGDTEVLLLRDEKWEFISEEQDKTPDVASEMPRGRKGRGNSVQALKEGNAETPKSDGGDLPKKRGRPKGVRSSNGTPNNGSSATPSKSKGKTASKDVHETLKTGSDLKKEGEKGSKDKGTRSADKTKDDLPKDSSNQNASKPKEAGSKGKDSKDESKSGEGKAKPGRKPKGAGTPAASDGSVKEKRKEKEGEAAEMEQDASGKASTGSEGKDSKDENKSGEGKAKPGRKPKGAGTPAASDGSVKEKRKEKEGEAAEMEQEASGKASIGSKGKDSKDENKSGEGKAKPGRKPKGAGTPAASDGSVKEKREKEGEAAEMEQEASGKASTGSKGKDWKDENKSGEGKAKPGRKPKGAGTPAASDGSVKEKRKEKEGEAAEMEQEASGKASTGKKRRRKA